MLLFQDPPASSIMFTTYKEGFSVNVGCKGERGKPGTDVQIKRENTLYLMKDFTKIN